MKKNKIQNKFFNNNEEYFRFLKKVDIKILKGHKQYKDTHQEQSGLRIVADRATGCENNNNILAMQQRLGRYVQDKMVKKDLFENLDGKEPVI